MPVHTGSEGVIKVGTNTIGNLRSYSYSETAGTIETSTLSATAKTYKAGQTTWTGSCDVFLDEDDAGQDALTVGSEVTMNFYFEGATTGDTYHTGTAIVTEISRSAAIDGMVEASISLQGTGALTESTA